LRGRPEPSPTTGTKQSLDTIGIEALFLFSPHSLLALFTPIFLVGFWSARRIA
jgi:hypothetical protein